MACRLANYQSEHRRPAVQTVVMRAAIYDDKNKQRQMAKHDKKSLYTA